MLSEKQCTACRGDSHPLTQEELDRLLPDLPGWKIEQAGGVNQLVQVYKFKDFVQAMAFTQAVGALAEEFGHHPALLTEWGRVKVSWWTHKIKGLHENDAIMAAKTGQLFTARFANS